MKTIPARITGLIFLSAALLALGSWQAAAAPQASALLQVSPSSGDWPMYGHDPSRNNYNPSETLLSAGDVDQIVSRWQSRDLGSNGFATSSAPSVANGKVYVGSSTDTGDNYFAFDAATGAPAWSANIGYEDDCAQVGIGSTAAISGTTLVVGGGDKAYYGLDADTGRVLWRNSIETSGDVFAWSSPLLVNGRAYIGIASQCSTPSVRGELRAIDLDDGITAGSQYMVPDGDSGGGIWNSPALSPDGTRLVVATGNDEGTYSGDYTRSIVSLDPLSLDIKASHQESVSGHDFDFGTTPIIFHDSENRVLVGANEKDGTFHTYVLDSLGNDELWTRPMGVRIGMMPAYDPTFGPGGTLFVVGASARLYAVNPATGNNRWPDVEANGRGNMAIANGLIFLNDNGVLRILDETNGSVLRVIIPDHQGNSNSGVAVSNGFVYWLSGSYLNAWSLPEGSEPTPAPMPSMTTTLPPVEEPTASVLPSAVPTSIAVPGMGSQLFPETGETVSGIFLDYWNNNGGLAQQGYPISEPLEETSDVNGKTYLVQYFERAVFEYHPENQPPYQVLLSLLGEYQYNKTYPNGALDQMPNASSDAQMFPETGKTVGGAFLAYWQAHGGVMQQGYPISDEFMETSALDGKPYLVQYFERAEFEYHPENTPPNDVLLSQLGTEHMQHEP